jgi:hypothetical protein
MCAHCGAGPHPLVCCVRAPQALAARAAGRGRSRRRPAIAGLRRRGRRARLTCGRSAGHMRPQGALEISSDADACVHRGPASGSPPGDRCCASGAAAAAAAAPAGSGPAAGPAVAEALVPMLVCRRRPPRRELVLRALLRRGVWPKGMLPRRDVVEARRPKRAWCAATARSMISWKAGR